MTNAAHRRHGLTDGEGGAIRRRLYAGTLTFAVAMACGAAIGIGLELLGQRLFSEPPAPVRADAVLDSDQPSHAYRFIRKALIGRQQEELDRAALQFYLRSGAERFAG